MFVRNTSIQNLQSIVGTSYLLNLLDTVRQIPQSARPSRCKQQGSSGYLLLQFFVEYVLGICHGKVSMLRYM